MPGFVASRESNRKRKQRPGDDSKDNQVEARKAPKQTKSDDAQTQILLLEEQIIESREHYNNIVKLQQWIHAVDQKPKTGNLSAVALCRVFCRLIAGEKLIS